MVLPEKTRKHLSTLTGAIPFLAFFASGASSLIFQTIWTRHLHHVFGATSVAISTVLTAFMAGLGLGNWLAGKHAHRVKNPLLWYAIFEGCVGLWGLWMPSLLSPTGVLAQLNLELKTQLGPNSIYFMIGRFLCVFPVLLIPTTMMGATLPLLTRFFVDQSRTSDHGNEKDSEKKDSTAKRVGLLYAVNTFGAALGPLLSAFVLMPNIHLHATNLVACSMNLALALIVFLWLHNTARVVVPIAEPQTTPKINSPRDWPTRFALIAFGVSGATAMAYEVVWSRALAMTIGSSIYSFALILETFLIGIALGSAAVSFFFSDANKGLKWLSGFSLLSVLLVHIPWLLDFRSPTKAKVIHHHGNVSHYLIAIAISMVCILVLAWMSTKKTQHVFKQGMDVSWLVTLVPFLSAFINFLFIQLPKREEGFQGDELLGLVLTISALFTMWLLLLWTTKSKPLLQIAMLQLYVGVATIANCYWQDDIPLIFAHMLIGVNEIATHVGLVQGIMFFVSALSILPATLGMGSMFPSVIRAWTRGDNAASDVGVVYGSNTIGSIVGAWLPGFVLFSWLGGERTLHIAIALNILMSLIMLIAGADESMPETQPRAAADTAGDKDQPMPMGASQVSLYVLALFIPAILATFLFLVSRKDSILKWNLSKMTIGVFRVSNAEDAMEENADKSNIVYYKDGLSTTVSVEAWGNHHALKNNGKVDASNGADMPTQIMVAGYPLLMYPKDPKNVAVVGFGSGVSVGTALTFPTGHVDVIELERSIPEASKFFSEANHLEYPLPDWPYVKMDRLTVHADDGRNFLASTRTMYDVIISEPSNPWITGVSDLFTVEHFQISKKRLTPGGIYCQWVQLYEISPENIKTIYRTFASQFKHVMAFSADHQSSDTVLLGSDEPINMDIPSLFHRFENPVIAAELERAQILSPYDVASMVLFANKEEVLRFARYRSFIGKSGKPTLDTSSLLDCKAPGCHWVPAPLNTDNNARIEFAAPKDLIGHDHFKGYIWDSFYSADWPFGNFGNTLRVRRGQEADDHAELALSLIGQGRYRAASYFLSQAQTHVEQRAAPKEKTERVEKVLAYLLGEKPEPVIQVEVPSPEPDMDSHHRTALIEAFESAKKAIGENDFVLAASILRGLDEPVIRKSGPSFLFLYGYVLYQESKLPTGAGSLEDARDVLEDVCGNEAYLRIHPEPLYYLARSYRKLSESVFATRTMVDYVDYVSEKSPLLPLPTASLPSP